MTVGDGERYFFGALLGGSAAGRRLAEKLEGFFTAQVTMVLARLGVPDMLAGGPRLAGDIARQAGADPDALARVLAAAAVYGLVRRSGDGKYELTAEGELLRSDVPGSARNFAAGFLGAPMWECASRTAEIVLGAPAGPGAMYHAMGRSPEDARWFARAIGQIATILVTELNSSGFQPLASGQIVDVGGSRGTVLAHLLQSDPMATGVLFDRAEALAEAPAFLATAGVVDRVELAAGDFMAEVPPGGDVYVLSHVLHNWDDAGVRTLLGNCHRASRPGGSLLVIEFRLPDGPEPSPAQVLDLTMLAMTGGRERTLAEHEALMADAGYALARETSLTRVLPWRIMEFTRRPG
jgi:SAM-dependent methyltransferase